MAVVLGAPQQITDLWSDVQHLVEQAGTLLDRLELLLNRAEQKVDEIDGVLHRVRPLEMAAEEAVSHAQAVAVGVEQTRALADKQVQSLQRLLEEYEPSLRVLAPLVSQATRTLGPRHIAGITALLDQLPQLVDRIEPALTGWLASRQR